MSLFDYPRINITGTLTLNPATANNCDNAGNAYFPDDPDLTLALIDSKFVQPITFGMSDAKFIDWVQKAHPFNMKQGPTPQDLIPAEWNYFGDLGTSGTGTVVGVQTGPGQANVYTSVEPSVPLSALIGAPLTTSGHIADVNSEGSPPATQFFIQQMTLGSGSNVALQGKPSKGACQWLNFYRNVNLKADGGAGGYIYHVLYKGPNTTLNIPGFDAPNCIGAIFRYYIYNVQVNGDNAAVLAKYAQNQPNPATGQFVATIAPLLAGEVITTGPVGRLLLANNPTIPSPPNAQNNAGGGPVALAPTVIAQSGNVLVGDFSGTFPEYAQGDQNPKYDFGAVTLEVNGIEIGTVDYTDVTTNDQLGWMLELDISDNAAAQQALQDPNATLTAVCANAQIGTVLGEADYYFPSNQQAIYAEQTSGVVSSFLNQGTYEPATVPVVYSRGVPVPAAQLPQITLWAYRTVPMQSPGNAVALDTSFQPGNPIAVDASQPGDYLFTFTVAGDPPPPQSYNAFMFPPYITNSPSISLRILPNEDFSEFYVDPTAPEPVGNNSLVFELVYLFVLRTYYLLYPAMNVHIDLGSQTAVDQNAQAIIDRTDPALWMDIQYMPRTRDMSASRRTLLQAYCRKVLGG